MPVAVDREKCIGCGLCVSMCPDVFEFVDDNKAQAKAAACKSCDVKQVAQSCPVQAITAN